MIKFEILAKWYIGFIVHIESFRHKLLTKSGTRCAPGLLSEKERVLSEPHDLTEGYPGHLYVTPFSMQ